MFTTEVKWNALQLFVSVICLFSFLVVEERLNQIKSSSLLSVVVYFSFICFLHCCLYCFFVFLCCFLCFVCFFLLFFSCLLLQFWQKFSIKILKICLKFFAEFLFTKTFKGLMYNLYLAFSAFFNNSKVLMWQFFVKSEGRSVRFNFIQLKNRVPFLNFK